MGCLAKAVTTRRDNPCASARTSARPSIRPLTRRSRPVIVQNVYFFARNDAENYKRALMGLEPLPVEPNAPIQLVRLVTFAKELGCHPLTLKRRISRPETPAPAAPVKRRARSLEEV